VIVMRRVLAVALVLALAACGQKTDLKPVAGKQLPPPPYGREERPSVARLLDPPPQAVPERSVELRKRSEPREDDPFDLPPPE
jgi:predicted small lipoprotein YifL